MVGCCRTLSQHRGSLRGMRGSRNSMTLTSCIAEAGKRHQTFFQDNEAVYKSAQEHRLTA